MTDGLDPHFDDDYLYFHERVHHPARNQRQVGFVWDELGLSTRSRVLDVPCGFGRLATGLAMRGCDVTGVDLNPRYIAVARETAAAAGVSVDLRVQDMRELEWTESFDALICWYISFGYFDDDTDRAILRGFRRVLKPGGRIMFELVHLPSYLRSLSAGGTLTGQTHRDDDSMLIEASFNLIESCNEVRRTVRRDGDIRVRTWSVRFFTTTEIRSWLTSAGFTGVRFTNRSGGPLSLEDDRMFVTVWVSHA